MKMLNMKEEIHNKKDMISAPFKDIPISKIIYKDISSKKDYKFIFVGPQPDNIKKLLNKFLAGENLTNEEHKKLDNRINFYNKKLNIIQDTNTINKFVYYHLETNISVKTLQFLFQHLIKKENILTKDELGDKTYADFSHENQLVYVFNIKIGYKKIVSILNFIFKEESELDNTEFIEKLTILFNINKKQLINKINKINENSSFLNKKIYLYSDLLYSDIFYKLLLSLPNILTFKYKTSLNNVEYDYYNNHNISTIILD